VTSQKIVDSVTGGDRFCNCLVLVYLNPFGNVDEEELSTCQKPEDSRLDPTGLVLGYYCRSQEFSPKAINSDVQLFVIVEAAQEEY
jgi:hypothetical protein